MVAWGLASGTFVALIVALVCITKWTTLAATYPDPLRFVVTADFTAFAVAFLIGMTSGSGLVKAPVPEVRERRHASQLGFMGTPG
jgi:hypothetical protein